jgi:magnesium transporter
MVDVNYYANSCEKQRCKVAFHTIPVGVVFKVKFVTISFHQTEMLTDFVIYTNEKKINIKDNFD